MWVKWKLVLVQFEIVLILTQDRYTVCVECAIGLEIILEHPMELLRDVGQVEARSGLFRDSVNLDIT
jgi:hypothetical protein